MNLYKYILGIAFLFFGINAMAQTETADFFKVNSGEGNGVKFWGADNYKIHMGDSDVYHYGPVTGYSIKTNMNGTAGRGWTWGILGQTPIAALNNQGVFQTKGTIKTEGSLQTMSRYLYFGATQRLIGDNASALTWVGNHSIVTQLIMKDKEGTQYGRIYGDGNGTNFGLTDGDGHWSYRAVKDQYTEFRVNNAIRMSIKNGSVEVYNTPLYVIAPGNATGLISLSGPGGQPGIHAKSNSNFRADIMRTDDAWSFNLGTTSTSSVTRMKLFNNGKLLVGPASTATPGNYGIYVPSGILSGEIVVADVSSSDWADDVFETENYDLMDVEERKLFIAENKHLPYIPSAKEIEEKGLNVVEVMAGITRNVEEMNVLMIQKEETISQQTTEIQNLQKLLLEMNSRLERLEKAK